MGIIFTTDLAGSGNRKESLMLNGSGIKDKDKGEGTRMEWLSMSQASNSQLEMQSQWAL